MEKTWAAIAKRIGPGLITAAVVLGPGSIVAASRAGAESEYRLVWIQVISCIFMLTYTSMGARLGCSLFVTPLEYIAQRWGRILAALTGLSGFLVAAGFQFGNNIGVSVAMDGLIEGLPNWVWPVVFTGLAMAFMFYARHVYKLLEKLMLALVATMIIAFVGNLFWTGIDPLGFVKGLVPPGLQNEPWFQDNDFVISRAMLGTTFSAVAAFYQAYLVRAKGWRRENINRAITDSWIGISTLTLIALIILIGAAQALHGTGDDFANVGQLASQLQGALGGAAILIFSLGLAAASFSSFIANALIGGALMADGLGEEAHIGSRPTKVWTAAVMLIGCLVAIGVMVLDMGGTTSLLIAQGATLIASPLCALLLFGLTCSKAVMGDLRNGIVAIVLGLAGLAVIGWLNILLLLDLIAKWSGG